MANTVNTDSNTPHKYSRAAYWSTRFAVLGLLLVVLVVFLHRLEMMHFSKAIIGLLVGALLGLLAVVISVVGMFTSHKAEYSGQSLSWVGRILGLLAASPVLITFLTASGVPPIHDISTDLQNPPAFKAILDVRTETHNPLGRQNPSNLEALQRKAYPDLKPILINKPVSQVFDQAQALVATLGWQVVASSQSKGRIEATAVTPIMRFKDDVIIRIQEAAGGATVDMRSVSRVGKSDLGANATRIRAFMTELQSK